MPQKINVRSFAVNMSRMLEISNCDVIYYVIYVICSHYVRKAISPLFAWASSYDYEIKIQVININVMQMNDEYANK